MTAMTNDDARMAKTLLRGAQILKIMRDSLYENDMSGEDIDPIMLDEVDHVLSDIDSRAPGILDDDIDDWVEEE